jgi:hypothetical protein
LKLLHEKADRETINPPPTNIFSKFLKLFCDEVETGENFSNVHKLFCESEIELHE